MTKWTEELTARLNELAGSKDEEVSRETVEQIATELDISNRSAGGKLRKEGYTVQKVGATPKSYSEDEEAQLREILENNKGELTYDQIVEQLGTDHTARSVRGKILSMEMTEYVAPTPPKEVERSYTDEETDTVREMAQSGKFVEEIAEAVGKPVASVRGKALSLLRAGEISELPKTRDLKPQAADVFNELGDSISGMTVEELMEKTGKTERGVKTILTRRSLTAKDYDGRARAEKAAARNS